MSEPVESTHLIFPFVKENVKQNLICHLFLGMRFAEM